MSLLDGAPAGGEADSPPAVELVGITKRFGRVVACDRVDLTLRRGQVHGILGENGAGKSTLMKVLIGLVLPDAGQIRLAGTPVQIVDPVDAAERGIAHGPPALQPRGAAHRVGERGPRRHRPPRPASRSGSRGGDQRAVRPPDRPRRPDLRPAGRPAPAGRDHQVPPPRPAGPGLRRADVGADAGRVGLPLLGAAAGGRGRGEGCGAGQPQAARGDVGHGRDHHHARRAGGRDQGDGIERCGLAGPGDGRAGRVVAG